MRLGMAGERCNKMSKTTVACAFAGCASKAEFSEAINNSEIQATDAVDGSDWATVRRTEEMADASRGTRDRMSIQFVCGPHAQFLRERKDVG
jgi:hypothetical protein